MQIRNSIQKKAYAKVNLSLDVLRKREDGYHEVKMIMQTINLFDNLLFERIDKNELIDESKNIEIILEETSKQIDGEVDIPLDDSNLIYKACKMLMDEFDIKDGVRIRLEKNIPVAAGMAGGSTDCAATFKGINELFNLGLSEKDLMERGVKLGADVPYCIMGGTALSCGIGEILTKLPGIPHTTFLIAKPTFGVSTKEVYTNLRANELTKDEHPDVDKMIDVINEFAANHNVSEVTDNSASATENAVTDNAVSDIAALLGNVLEKVTVNLHPEIEIIKNIMKENGALNALMSGSGPTVFGIYDSSEKAFEASIMLSELDYIKDIFVVEEVH